MMLLLALLLAQSQSQSQSQPPGLALLKKGHYLEAKKVIEQHPEDLLALAELRLVEREVETAEELVKKALEQSPNDAHAHFMMGRIAGEQAMAASIFSKMGYA